MTHKFSVGDTAFFCQGKDVIDVGLVVGIINSNFFAPDRYIKVKWQKLGKTKSHREDQLSTHAEVYNESV